jgi:hypothetical protein
MTRLTDYRRLEPWPADRDLEHGFAAVLHDPVWMLARQWQMGEHQAENASSPVRVTCRVRETPIAPYRGLPHLDPQSRPIEPIVEAEPDSWWTLGRRVRLGAAVAATEGLDNRQDLPASLRLRFVNPPPPYEQFHGAFDGLALWQNRATLQIADQRFGPGLPPAEGPDSWDAAELVYQAEFQTRAATLTMPRHAGGDVDWYSADAGPAPAPGALPSARVSRHGAFPTPFEYPGAPNERWWAIENAAVDIGGYPPDRTHFPTLLLIDLIVSHSNDWFLFPVPAHVGQIVTLSEVEVTDCFGDPYTVLPPANWSLFRTTGLDASSLVLWPTVLTALQGPALEEVQFGIDEYSNYLWAVERRTHGREVPTPPQPAAPAAAMPDTRLARRYAYRPSVGLATGWHPYVPRDETVNGRPRRRFVQAVINPALDPTAGLGEPTAAVLGARDDGTLAFVHQVEPATVPSNGIAVERNWMFARDVGGNPVLWVQRRRKPLLSPPSRQVRLDVFEEVT